MKFCPDCGAKIIGAGRFCSECGQELTPSQPSSEVEEIDVEGLSLEELKAKLWEMKKEIGEEDSSPELTTTTVNDTAPITKTEIKQTVAKPAKEETAPVVASDHEDDVPPGSKPVDWWRSYKIVGNRLFFGVCLGVFGGLPLLISIILAIVSKNPVFVISGILWELLCLAMAFLCSYLTTLQIKRSTCKKCHTIISSEKSVAYTVLGSVGDEHGTKTTIKVTITCPKCGEQWSFTIKRYTTHIDENDKVTMYTPRELALGATAVGAAQATENSSGISRLMNKLIEKSVDRHYEKHYKNKKEESK